MVDRQTEEFGCGLRSLCSPVVAFGVVLGLALAPPAAARGTLLTLWQVQTPAAAPAERAVSDGETVLRQTLLPTGLAVLDVDVADTAGSRLVAKAGAQLIEASTGNGKIYCALSTLRSDKKTGALSENRSAITLCLIDSDANGRFENLFEMPAGVGLPMIQGQLPKKLRPIDAGYVQRPVTEVQGEFWVGIRYEQYFNIYGNRMFFTDYGGRGQTQSLTEFAKFKSKGPFPQSVTVSGAKFTVLSADAAGVKLRTDAPLPDRPFAVTTYTTTTFIPIRY